MARRRTSNSAPLPGFKPKPRSDERTVESAKGPDFRLSVPTARVGGVVPFVLGRKAITEPNLIWVGAARALVETRSVTTTRRERDYGTNGAFREYDVTEVVTTTSVIGYLVNLQLALCLGPGVILRRIVSGDVTLWEGNVGPNRSTFTIPVQDTPYDNVEVVFRGGAFDQPPDADIIEHEPEAPGYVGIAYVIFKGVRADLPLGNLVFEVERFPNPLAIGGDNRIGNDINLATMLYEVITNRWGAGGLDPSFVDVAQLATIADTLHAEGNVGSLIITSIVSVASVIDMIQDQADAIVFADPGSGLVRTTLIRPNTTPVVARFGIRTISELRNFNKSGWSNTAEQAVGEFLDRDRDYQPVPVFSQNPAQLQVSGRGKRTVQFEYPLVHDRSLATQLLARDLAQMSEPTFSSSLLVNRTGSSLVPGNVITVTDNRYQLVSTRLLVTNIRRQPIDVNSILLEVEQLLLPEWEALIAEPVEPPNVNIDFAPVTPDSVRFITAPYWVARSAAGVSSVNEAPPVFPIVLPLPANNFQTTFTAYIDNVPGSTQEVLTIDDSSFPTRGTLQSAIGAYDAFDDGILDTVVVQGVINPTNMRSIGIGGVEQGTLLMFVGDEVMSFESVSQLGPGVYELANVHRGLLDTVPTAHGAGAVVMIVSNNYRNVGPGFALPLAYTPDWLITSNTLSRRGRISDALASSAWSETQPRTLAPLRPHDVHVNGDRDLTSLTLVKNVPNEVSWNIRSRTSLRVASQDDASEEGEIDFEGRHQTHTVWLTDSDAVTHELGTTLDDADYSSILVTPDSSIEPGPGTLWVRSNFRGQSSLFWQTIPVDVYETGARITEDESYRVTEGGDRRSIE